MSNFRSWRFSPFLFVCVLVLFSRQSGGANYSDQTVESLMGEFKNREAFTHIQKKIQSCPERDKEALLYYYVKGSSAARKIGKMDSALVLARKALSLAKRSRDSVQVVQAWRAAAFAYNTSGNLDSALVFSKIILDFAERKGDYMLKRDALSSLSSIFMQNKRYREALKFRLEINSINLKVKDSVAYANGIYNTGLTYKELGKIDSAVLFLNQSARLAKSTHDPDLSVYAYGTLSDLYLSLNNKKEWRRNLLLANEFALKTGNLQYLAMGYSNLCSEELNSGNYQKAIDYGEKSLSILKSHPYLALSRVVDSLMYLANKKSGNYKQALVFHELFYRDKSTLLSEKQKKQLDELLVRFQIQYKDLTISNQNLKLIKEEKRREFLFLLLVIILIISIGQVIYLVKANRYRLDMFRKEKELQLREEEIREWIEWKQKSGNLDGGDLEDANSSNLNENAQQHILFSELRDVFQKEKLFLNPDLNLKTVVKTLGTNKRYLSEAISHNSDHNFRSFLNRYRIDEAKRLIEDGIKSKVDINISELFLKTGFNSSVSFYRSFKNITGLTPREYILEARKDFLKGESN